MAIYHLTTKVVARSKGHSAIAAAAYRARMEITNDRTGETWNYSRKSGDVLFTGIYAPKDSPEWMQDRAKLWNGVELFEKRKDAQVARDFIIGLPNELTHDQQRYALQDWVRENFVRKGYVADVAIHRPSEEGDQRNAHAHVLVTMRQVDGDRFAAKKERSADRLADLEQWRESWEKIGNRHLIRHGHGATLDRRTLEAQGVDRLPQIHIGKDAAEMERKGIHTDRGDILHAIQRQNLARDLERKYAHKVTVHEMERPAMMSVPKPIVIPEPPELAEPPQDQPQAESRAPKGQGILATIWNFARASTHAIGGIFFGPSRSLLPVNEPHQSEPVAEPLLLRVAPEHEDQTHKPLNSPLPTPTGDNLGRVEEILDSLVAKTEPPPVTRELTMVERLQQRVKQDLATELPHQTRERQRKLAQDLDLDL